MSRDEGGSGIVAVVRGHVVETVLVVLSALAFLLGVVWNDEVPAAMRVMGQPADDVDARAVSALLEVRDGRWRVRDVVSVPTLGTTEVELEHRSRATLLFPLPKQAWSAGGPSLRWSVPEWRFDLSLDVVRHHVQGRSIAVRDGGASSRGWRMPQFHGVSAVNTPMIATGFNPLGWAMGYAPAGGDLLHLCVLTEDDRDYSSVDAWRELVVREADRTRPLDYEIVTATALAAVLRVEDAVPLLRRYRDSREDPPTRTVTNLDEILDGALTVLPSGGADVPPTALLDHFVDPMKTLGWMQRVYAGAPCSELLESLDDRTDAWTPREPMRGPRAPTIGVESLILLAFFGTLVTKGPAHVRRRDVVGVAGLLLVASLGLAFVPHVTLESAGLTGLGASVLMLQMRGAIRPREGVALAFVCAAILLPLASVFVLPVLDAATRALVFGGIAVLAVGALDPRPVESDSPRRTSRKRETLWASFQVLAVTLAVLALLMALLNPGSWATRAPRPKWIVTAVGLVLGLAAGLTVYLRDRERRVQPAAAVAVTLGAASHLAVLPLSTFVTEWTSGAKEVAAIGMIAAGIASLFVVLRLGRMAYMHRVTPAPARVSVSATEAAD